MAECGFAKDAAVVACGALVEKANERFGDCISARACLAGLKSFFSSGVDTKCRSCGYRKPKSRFCTMRFQDTSDSDTCGEFRHLYVVEAK